jgi:hypothetical protein
MRFQGARRHRTYPEVPHSRAGNPTPARLLSKTRQEIGVRTAERRREGADSPRAVLPRRSGFAASSRSTERRAVAGRGVSSGHDARSPILRRDLQSNSAPLAASLIASASPWRLDRSMTSSERCGGAERVGVGAGAGVSRGRGLGAGDRAAAGDQPEDGRAVGAERGAAALSAGADGRRG